MDTATSNDETCRWLLRETSENLNTETERLGGSKTGPIVDSGV